MITFIFDIDVLKNFHYFNKRYNSEQIPIRYERVRISVVRAQDMSFGLKSH